MSGLFTWRSSDRLPKSGVILSWIYSHSQANCKVKRFLSCHSHPLVDGMDALIHPWVCHLAYVLPPNPLILKFRGRLLSEALMEALMAQQAMVLPGKGP